MDLLPKLLLDQLIIRAAALFEFLFSIVRFTVGAHHAANSGFPPALQTEPVFGLYLWWAQWHLSYIPLCLSAQDTALQNQIWSPDNCLLCDRRQTTIHGDSIATIMSRRAHFPFLPFSMGLSSDVRTAWGKPDRRVYFSFMATSLIKGQQN